MAEIAILSYRCETEKKNVTFECGFANVWNRKKCHFWKLLCNQHQKIGGGWWKFELNWLMFWCQILSDFIEIWTEVNGTKTCIFEGVITHAGKRTFAFTRHLPTPLIEWPDIRLHQNWELDIRLQGHWTFAYIKTKDWIFAYTSKKRTGHSPT